MKEGMVEDIKRRAHIKKGVNGGKKVKVMHAINQSGESVSIRRVISGMVGVDMYIDENNSVMGGGGSNGRGGSRENFRRNDRKVVWGRYSN